MPGWLTFVSTAVLVLGHLGVGRQGASFLHAFGTIFFMFSASYAGGEKLATQLLVLAISSGMLWVRSRLAQAAYQRRVQRVAQFRDDVYAARRNH